MDTYVYAMLMRPPQLGAMPTSGMVSCSCEPVVPPSGHHTWGWVKYNRKLTDKEVSDYELEFIKEGDYPNE